MKKVTVALFLMAAVLLMGSAAMADKIGFVDFSKVVDESEQGKKASASLESFIKSHEAKLEEKKKTIDTQNADFEKKKSAMSEDAKKKKQEEIQSMARELNRSVQEVQEEFQKKKQELYKDIVKDIRDIVNAMGKEEGYTAILDARQSIYILDSTDLTSKVIKKYNDTAAKKK
ncbi:MAG: OmpH family outer membrane protein [Nitrospirae bacterium]|nr:OmpH family outer membrane protein [Nitrospirota bacterium]